MDINTLRTGDLIVREKGPLSTHYMVWIGWHNGAYRVAENQVGHGVRFTTFTQAMDGNSIIRFEKFGGTEAQRQQVVPRIQQFLGRGYDLVVFNCEHFARWISTGKMSSSQVTAASNILIASGALMAASKNKTLFSIGLTCIALGGLGHLSQK
jgi:hypothetical protein